MLSDQEKAELLEMAASKAVRDSFEHLRRAARESESRVDFGGYLRFLDGMARLCEAAPSRERPAYTEARL